MVSIWAYLDEVESQAREGLCGQPNLLPLCPVSPEEEPLLRASFSRPLCSPGSLICIATRRPLRRWRGPPQAARHTVWVRAPAKPISPCPLQHFLTSLCDCPRCGVRGGGGVCVCGESVGLIAFYSTAHPNLYSIAMCSLPSTLNLRMRPART